MYLTATIEREGDGYVALCPELDIASQGKSINEARGNLREALALFYETASSQEIKERFQEEVRIKIILAETFLPLASATPPA